jgi:AcrR family transcriptional regulator
MPTDSPPVNAPTRTVRDVTFGPTGTPPRNLAPVTDGGRESGRAGRAERADEREDDGRRPSRHHRGERAERGGPSRAERKERTRQSLLDVTLKLIAQRALASISLREVAREAGIVPTAFYRHFESMDELGVELVDQSMRPLRQMIRDARRGGVGNDDIIKGTVAILGAHVRANRAEYQFLTRERYGGVAAVRRAIDTELRLFTSELTVDLARLTAGYDWSSDDLEMTADLMVSTMLTTVMALLEVDRRRADEEQVILDRAEKQLRIIALGMGQWRSAPERSRTRPARPRAVPD